jgi:hypothetical protein
MQHVHLEVLDTNQEVLVGAADFKLSQLGREGLWTRFPLLKRAAPQEGYERDQNAQTGHIVVQCAVAPITRNPAFQSLGEVFVGIEKISGVPRCQGQAKFWVDVECSNLLKRSPIQDAESKSTSTRSPPEPRVSKSTQRIEGRRLTEKVKFLDSRGLSKQDIANVLDMDIDLVQGIFNPANHLGDAQIYASAGLCDVTFDEGFRFVVPDPDNSTLSFTVRSRDSTSRYSDVTEIGSKDISLAKYLEGVVPYALSEIHAGTYGAVQERRCFQTSLDLGNDVHLHATIRVGFFGKSGIRIQ